MGLRLVVILPVTLPVLVHADWAREELKARLCDSLHAYIKAIEVEPCMNGRFKFVARERAVTDFSYRQGARRCQGTIYDDAGDIHVDYCLP